MTFSKTFSFIPIFLCWVGLHLFQHANAGPLLVEIDDLNDFDRVVVVSDVHGKSGKLSDLLWRVGLLPDDLKSRSRDLVIVIGDSIQKGNHSLEVLDLWIQLQGELSKRGGRLIHLLGNHEFRRLIGKKPRPELQKELKAKGLSFAEFISEKSKYGRFFAEMPLALRVSDALFLHAGNPSVESFAEFFEKYDSAVMLAQSNSPLEDRDWFLSDSQMQLLENFMIHEGLKQIYFGHDAAAFSNSFKNEIVSLEFSNGRSLVKTDTEFAGGGYSAGQLLLFKKDKAVPDQKFSGLKPQVVSRLGCNEILTLQHGKVLQYLQD